MKVICEEHCWRDNEGNPCPYCEIDSLKKQLKKTYTEWPCNDGTVDIVEICPCCDHREIVRYNLAEWQVPHELQALRDEQDNRENTGA